MAYLNFIGVLGCLTLVLFKSTNAQAESNTIPLLVYDLR